jgi:hypothetical protein
VLLEMKEFLCSSGEQTCMCNMSAYACEQQSMHQKAEFSRHLPVLVDLLAVLVVVPCVLRSRRTWHGVHGIMGGA